MGKIENEQEQIRQKASQDMVILMENWKKRKQKLKYYRLFLKAAFVFSCIALIVAGYFSLYRKLPSVIRIKSGIEQSLNLGLPLTAKVAAVSEQEDSNIPRQAITINLSNPVTLKPGSLDSYEMDVKLFGWIPFKQVNIQVIEEQELTPMGVPVGIYVETDGLLVIGIGEFNNPNGISCAPCKNILRSGDYIRSMNGEPVTDKNKFIKDIEANGQEAIVLTIDRDGQTMDVKIQPQQNENGLYKIGAWIRDNAQGVGTMTFIDAEGNFGALGHGINDIDTSTLMEMNDGTLYQTEIIAIKKGKSNEPGEMTGMIIYSSDRILGDITANNTHGIFGSCNQKALNLATNKPLPIGLKQDIKKGYAQILCTVDDTPQYFDVEILNIHLNHDNVNRGIELKVTDPELLEATGGIVQGMSGSPVIQNGKLVGAVTHVLVNDPTRGYAIFIENMLETVNQTAEEQGK